MCVTLHADGGVCPLHLPLRSSSILRHWFSERVPARQFQRLICVGSQGVSMNDVDPNERPAAPDDVSMTSCLMSCHCLDSSDVDLSPSKRQTRHPDCMTLSSSVPSTLTAGCACGSTVSECGRRLINANCPLTTPDDDRLQSLHDVAC